SLLELLHRLGVHAERAGNTADGGHTGCRAPRLDEVEAAGRHPGLLGQFADGQQAVGPERAERWHRGNLSDLRETVDGPGPAGHARMRIKAQYTRRGMDGGTHEAR